MTSHNSHQILMKLKNMLTQVRTFLMGLYQAVYLAVYLIIKLPPLLVKALLERLFSPSQWLRTSLILILIVIVSILTLKLQLIKDYLSLVGLT